MKEKRLMAFWKYDTYPYHLWGEVFDIDQKGYALIIEYQYRKFKPVLILPYEEGKELANKLYDLKMKRLLALKQVEADFADKLNELIPFKGE
jgi:hypothetical protein